MWRIAACVWRAFGGAEVRGQNLLSRLCNLRGGNLSSPWFRGRGYRHLDVAISVDAAVRICTPTSVATHPFLPLLKYEKKIKRYKPLKKATVFKSRDIMYASHRDSCIFSKYSYDLTNALDTTYNKYGISENVIAYRKLGMANYQFSARALDFIQGHVPCVALCFDISGFFDSLDHGILKSRLKKILDVRELPRDWYQVFKRITRYSFVEKACLESHCKFGKRFSGPPQQPICTIQEVIDAGIDIFSNPNQYGIPQGTPISSAMSNLYMLDVDKVMAAVTAACGGLYQRYSDDILLVCTPKEEVELVKSFRQVIKEHKLELNDEKTERTEFDGTIGRAIQYLGFNLSENAAVIRQSSMSKRWRSAKRSIRRIRKIGSIAVLSGKATKIYTSSLRHRFQPIGVRNFSRYARRAAATLGSRAILKQVRRLERMVAAALRDLNPPKP